MQERAATGSALIEDSVSSFGEMPGAGTSVTKGKDG